MNMTQVLTDTGLNLPETYTKQQFDEAGRFLAKIEHGMQWAIGDWYNAIPEGEDKTEACERVGLNPSTASSYGAVSSCFEPVLRRTELSFGHHETLCIQGLTDIQRQELLQKAMKNSWTRADLTRARNKVLGRPEKTPLLTFDAKVDKVTAELPTTASKKLRRALASAMDSLKRDFQKEVHHFAQEQVKTLRKQLTEAREQVAHDQEIVKGLRQSLPGLMSEEEYKTILGCLHPDRAPKGQEDKFSKAFKAFKRVGDSVNTSQMPKASKDKLGWS